MKLRKGKDVVELKDPIHIRAYKNAGYEEVDKKPEARGSKGDA